jgi:chaperone modulatory protein CbpM
MTIVFEELEILEPSFHFSLRELCQRTGVSAEFVLELVDHGILEPTEPASQPYAFGPAALPRLQCARRLRHDLQVNLPGIAMSLDLLEEIRELRAEVKRLRHSLKRFNTGE